MSAAQLLSTPAAGGIEEMVPAFCTVFTMTVQNLVS
jgi:hypothetical protein